MGEIAESIEIKPSMVLIKDPGKIFRPHSAQTRLTKAKKIEYLKQLAKCFNKTKAAYAIGISQQGIDYHRKKDPIFQDAINLIKRGHIDNVEEIMFEVACLPSREGSTDRKTIVQALHDDYKKQPEVQTNIQINIDTGNEMKSILSRIMPDND